MKDVMPPRKIIGCEKEITHVDEHWGILQLRLLENFTRHVDIQEEAIFGSRRVKINCFECLVKRLLPSVDGERDLSRRELANGGECGD